MLGRVEFQNQSVAAVFLKKPTFDKGTGWREVLTISLLSFTPTRVILDLRGRTTDGVKYFRRLLITFEKFRQVALGVDRDCMWLRGVRGENLW